MTENKLKCHSRKLLSVTSAHLNSAYFCYQSQISTTAEIFVVTTPNTTTNTRIFGGGGGGGISYRLESLSTITPGATRAGERSDGSHGVTCQVATRVVTQLARKTRGARASALKVRVQSVPEPARMCGRTHEPAKMIRSSYSWNRIPNSELTQPLRPDPHEPLSRKVTQPHIKQYEI